MQEDKLSPSPGEIGRGCEGYEQEFPIGGVPISDVNYEVLLAKSV